MSHLPNKGPFIENKGNLKWSQRIMSLTDEDILWYSRSYDNVKIILKNGNFYKSLYSLKQISKMTQKKI